MTTAEFSARYRTAFVTGASTGLGLAFTDMLLASGVEVWGTSRDVKRLPVRLGFHPVALELGHGVELERIFLDAQGAAQGFDIVINNAGFGAFGTFAGTDFSVWEEQFRLMLVNTARLSHLALRGMLPRRRGALVNISSLAAEFALPYQSVYNSTKAGLSALNESLMYEVRDTGVIVLDFRPGDYRTDFEGSVRRPAQDATDTVNVRRMERVWSVFEKLMQSGPPPAHAAAALRRALVRGESTTVRAGRFFQAVMGPFLARLGSLALRRRVQSKYFGI